MADLGDALAAADAASRNGNRPEALRILQGLCAEFPNNPVPILRASSVLIHMQRFDEAEALLEAQQSRFPAEAGFALGHAWSAHYRGDIPKALHAWQEAQERFPDNWYPAFGKATTLSVAGQRDEAATALEQAMARWPDVAELAIAYARLAQTKSSWSEAVGRWEKVRVRFPERTEGYSEAVQVLRVLRRPDDAESILDAAVARFGDSAGIATERIRLSLLHDPLDREAVLRHVAHVRERYSDHAPGYEVAVDALRKVGLTDEAEELAASGVQRFPDNIALGVQYVQMPHTRCDIQEVILRASALRQHFPRHPLAYSVLISELTAAGRLDEAERVGAEGEETVPGDFDIAFARASVLVHRQDWKAALSAFMALRERFPQERRLERQIFETRLRMLETDPEAGELLGEHAVGDSGALRDLMMQFESLGAKEGGCEFGVVQRAFGAEPLGLLRWSDIAPERLIAALESDFAGVGDPDQTELLETPDAAGGAEYNTRDRRFGMRMHTFVHTDKIERNTMLAQSCRRLQFLRRKLLDDLAGATKVFVYKMGRQPPTPEEPARLSAALHRHGPNALLYVCFADLAHPNGVVEMVGPGLMIGYVGQFNVVPGEPLPEAVCRTWEAICRRAHELRAQWLSLEDSSAPLRVSDNHALSLAAVPAVFDIALAAPATPAPPDLKAASGRPGVTANVWRYIRMIFGPYLSRSAQ